MISRPKGWSSNQCHQCDSCYINGVFCHEHGCPVSSWKPRKRKPTIVLNTLSAQIHRADKTNTKDNI